MTDESLTHLDLDALADALAGEGDAPGAAHLASCSSCASRLGELRAAEAGLLATLAALPDPPLPDGLAARLTDALAGEAPLTAQHENVTALPARPPRRRLLPAAAAAVLLLSGGGLGYALLQDGAGQSADTLGAAAARVAAPPTSSSGTDYADPAGVTSALPGVLAGVDGAVPLDSTADSAAGSAGSQSQAETAMTADALARLRTPEGLADCLRGVLPPEEPGLSPLALDYARFQGQPALAVVLPDPEPGKLSVYVVGPDCAAADAKVLGFLRVDAP